MFCWQARKGFADRIDGVLDGDLQRHLDACPACRADLEGLGRAALIVSESKRVPPIETLSFEDRVLREGRARLAAARISVPTRVSLLRPVPLGAAVLFLMAAGSAAYFLDGASARLATVPAASVTAVGDTASTDLEDRLVAPPDVPFVVHEDLVGARRGRIPLTTYVLEPAPDEKAGTPVLRASL